MSRKIECLLLPGLFGLLALGGNESFAATCPELAGYTDIDTGCSFPYFSQGVDVSVTHKKSGSIKKIKGTYSESSVSSLLFAADDLYEISDTSLKFSVKTKKIKNAIFGGRETKGKVEIKGRIEELGIDKTEVLMKARLSGSWTVEGQLLFSFPDDTQLMSLQFKDFACNEKINAYQHQPCTSNHVATSAEYGGIILALNDGFYSNQNVTTTGTAVTSGTYVSVATPFPTNVTTAGAVVAPVPLPATVWIFGSGLLGLIGIARRKKAA